jgi:hypothetical protein
LQAAAMPQRATERHDPSAPGSTSIGRRRVHSWCFLSKRFSRAKALAGGRFSRGRFPGRPVRYPIGLWRATRIPNRHSGTFVESDAILLWKVTRKATKWPLLNRLGPASSIDHCGTFGRSAIDATHCASQTEKEIVFQCLPARGAWS